MAEQVYRDPDSWAFFTSLRFPGAMERDYRQDYFRRSQVSLRGFLILGLGLFLAFAVLDVWALPRTFPVAWALRFASFVAALGVLALTYTGQVRQAMFLAPNLLMFFVNLTIIAMIAGARPEEPAFTLYPIGLMFPMIAAYAVGGNLAYATLFGWLAIAIYLAVSIFHQDALEYPDQALTLFIITFFLVAMNLLGMSFGYLIERGSRADYVRRRIIDAQRVEEGQLRAESERLLLNVLPAPVADRLRRGEQVADDVPEASVLFADIVGFTPRAAQHTALEVVGLLNRIFSTFDELAYERGMEKIKTIGDAYMVVSGVPTPRPDHAEALADLALAMQKSVAEFRDPEWGDLTLRMGLNSGPVVAGIIGRRKFAYDLWGDTVNTASRMESHGAPGEIEVTEAVYRKLAGRYLLEARGMIEIKGKGPMPVWFLKGRLEGQGMGTELQELNDE